MGHGSRCDREEEDEGGRHPRRKLKFTYYSLQCLLVAQKFGRPNEKTPAKWNTEYKDYQPVPATGEPAAIRADETTATSEVAASTTLPAAESPEKSKKRKSRDDDDEKSEDEAERKRKKKEKKEKKKAEKGEKSEKKEKKEKKRKAEAEASDSD